MEHSHLESLLHHFSHSSTFTPWPLPHRPLCWGNSYPALQGTATSASFRLLALQCCLCLTWAPTVVLP